MKNKVAILLFILLITIPALADDPPEMRAVYIAIWDINSQAECDQAINNVLSTNLNAVFLHMRVRGDAYYFPNREDATYPNPEPRAQYESVSPSGLDVLQYMIDRLHSATPRREVHAWCTTYNSWQSSTAPSSPNHVYRAHPDWITENAAGTTFTYSDGAPLDPGIPGVQDYLYHVFMDIVRNYDIDGIQFDYIRLLKADSGYDPAAKARFKAETGWDYDTENTSGRLAEVYKAWRRDKVAELVQRVRTQARLEKPWVKVSAFLVNFSDSVETLAQGYNWWVAHDAIGVLQPGCYSSSVSGTVADWDFYISKLSQNGDQNRLPVVCAIGDYLLTAQNTVSAINTLRQKTRKPDGFNFYSYASLFKSGYPEPTSTAAPTPTPHPPHAPTIFGSGGPMANWASIPDTFLTPGQEIIAPNPPAAMSAVLNAGIPRITFQRPSPASDGDLPVHYRLYRDSASPVRVYYDNMVMEWWDLSPGRSSFMFDDVKANAGTWHYTAEAYDKWNNRATATAGPVTVTSSAAEYIIETRTGGKNIGDYSEPSGKFNSSDSHSTAPGCTPLIGSRFSLPTDGKNDVARFTPSGISSGRYTVYVTCFNYSSANAPGITVTTHDTDGTRHTTFNLTMANCGNKWTQCATMNFNAGQGHYVEFNSATQITSGSNDRMNPAAIHIVAILEASPKEPKPPVIPGPSGTTQIIVDSEPTALDFDDIGGSGKWLTTTFGENYGGSARYYSAASFPMNSISVWILDLPQAGRWAIDGYIRSGQTSLAQGVQYRFVDGNGVVRNSVATQRTGAGGFTINVDSVADAQAYSFRKGRVYVTLYGNTTGSEMIIADALRARLIEAEIRNASWALY
ncbi:MAG TPA: family 10 glycosylhydrolase [Candidatus Sumerlaeota bacterium]|nr:family 10 glycosylhydrolase [Candidatus Sumerlaeota bacterium]